MKEIKDVVKSKHGINPKILEDWINETLLDAEDLDIPGVVLKAGNKNPVTRYHIDRITLNNAGMPVEEVNRLY